ncbi:MAG: hypothetical protein F9K44_04415, partial [Hyphomicrobiaceae bacterium]
SDAARLAGVDLRRVVLYRMVAAERFSTATLNLLRMNEIDGVLLMSPRSAEIYLELIKGAELTPVVASIWHFCLSKAVAGPLTQEGFERIRLAARPNAQELLALIERVTAQSGQKS